MGAIIIITIGTAIGTVLALLAWHWIQQWLRQRVRAWKQEK